MKYVLRLDETVTLHTLRPYVRKNVAHVFASQFVLIQNCEQANASQAEIGMKF